MKIVRRNIQNHNNKPVNRIYNALSSRGYFNNSPYEIEQCISRASGSYNEYLRNVDSVIDHILRSDNQTVQSLYSFDFNLLNLNSSLNWIGENSYRFYNTESIPSVLATTNNNWRSYTAIDFFSNDQSTNTPRRERQQRPVSTYKGNQSTTNNNQPRRSRRRKNFYNRSPENMVEPNTPSNSPSHSREGNTSTRVDEGAQTTDVVIIKESSSSKPVTSNAIEKGEESSRSERQLPKTPSTMKKNVQFKTKANQVQNEVANNSSLSSIVLNYQTPCTSETLIETPIKKSPSIKKRRRRIVKGLKMTTASRIAMLRANLLREQIELVRSQRELVVVKKQAIESKMIIQIE